jgi:hypothetical protein
VVLQQDQNYQLCPPERAVIAEEMQRRSFSFRHYILISTHSHCSCYTVTQQHLVKVIRFMTSKTVESLTEKMQEQRQFTVYRE